MRNKAYLIGYETTQSYDNSEYLYYQLTPRQANILLSQTDYISWRTRWLDAPSDYDILEVRSEIANQLMNPIDGGFIVTAQELCDAVECGIIKVFTRAISGDAGNVVGGATINPDGSITYDANTGGTGGDTPIAVIRDNMGQAQYIEQQLEEYLANWNSLYALYGGTLTGTQVADSDLYKALAVLYDLAPVATSGEENFTTGVFVDYADLQINEATGVFTSLNELDRVIFCKGTAPSVISEFVFENGEDEPLLRSQMLSLVTQSQYEQWRTENTQISDDYVNAECYTLPDQAYSIPASQYPTTVDFQGKGEKIPFLQPISGINGSQVEVIISGRITGANGDYFDGMYNVVNGTATYKPIIFMNSNTAVQRLPDSQPLQSPGGYNVIYQNMQLNQHTIGWLNTAQAYTGSIDIIFRDR